MRTEQQSITLFTSLILVILLLLLIVIYGCDVTYDKTIIMDCMSTYMLNLGVMDYILSDGNHIYDNNTTTSFSSLLDAAAVLVANAYL